MQEDNLNINSWCKKITLTSSDRIDRIYAKDVTEVPKRNGEGVSIRIGRR